MKAILDEVLWRMCRHSVYGSVVFITCDISSERHSHTRGDIEEHYLKSDIKINAIKATVTTAHL